ncbi:unnamed protein product [Ceratitis capitata]|uniref:(Mediterranean fruit fly) hypothetical protein n=1 Tax=Ceratitis capitata TaxID=7213 RepID=A0A811VEI2_CERCA|nr:unnamed protein product [Ceratitis capitata]
MSHNSQSTLTAANFVVDYCRQHQRLSKSKAMRQMDMRCTRIDSGHTQTHLQTSDKPALLCMHVCIYPCVDVTSSCTMQGAARKKLCLLCTLYQRPVSAFVAQKCRVAKGLTKTS